MKALTLAPFVRWVDDLLAATGRLLDALSTAEALREAADRVSASNRDITAAIIGTRRDLERLLDKGIPSNHFATTLAPLAASLRNKVQNLERQRGRLGALPAHEQEALLPNFDSLLGETRRLDALLTDIVALTEAPLPAGFWERAEEAAAGPFFDETSVKAELGAEGKV